jgi:hypothetical protein
MLDASDLLTSNTLIEIDDGYLEQDLGACGKTGFF